MNYFADMHIHSHYSRATSKQLNFEQLFKWAQIKGITVVGSGDITHPGWLDEIKTKLEPAEKGLFRLKNEYAKLMQQEVPQACTAEVRFMLSGEISCIYKKENRVRKNHNVVFLPSVEVAEKFQNTLEKIGNIRSDGRPILGLDAKKLLEFVLESHEHSFLIPAHIWTPWFSVLGSKSGFNSIEECFEDLTPHIFALETGLSSDPPMNWRLSQLDRFTLVSNSDAHSPSKLAREANMFNCELSYAGMLEAMKSGETERFLGTIEFFPEEGKYHFDGHRKCDSRMKPSETIANNELCPVCGKKVTVGVSNRVEELADRPDGSKHENIKPFFSLIPLSEVLGEVNKVGPNTKTVTKKMETLQKKLGSEINILSTIPLHEIEKVGGTMLAEGIRRMREGEVQIAAGYDGEFGKITLFSDQERTKFSSQTAIFQEEPSALTEEENSVEPISLIQDKEENYKTQTDNNSKQTNQVKYIEDLEDSNGLNNRQKEAVNYDGNSLLIVAGPGTGKTYTLTHRLAHLIKKKETLPEHVLAVTFTNRAANEMYVRLKTLLDEDDAEKITVKTFHALGAYILRNEAEWFGYSSSFSIYSEEDKLALIKKIASNLSTKKRKELAEKISNTKNQLTEVKDNDSLINANGDKDFLHFFQAYQKSLQDSNAFDFDDLIEQPIKLFRENPTTKQKYQEKFLYIFIDEYQDINFSQYMLLQQLSYYKTNLCVIGDPDQAIYGFRGSDRRFFLRFQKDFPNAKTIRLEKNYRSVSTILKASSQIISKNEDHKPTNIWSNLVSETRIDIFNTPTEKAEAETIVHQIEQLVGATSFFSVDSGRAGERELEQCSAFSDIAVLYRTKAQLYALEEAFIRSGIPYLTLGDVPFFEKPEIKEIITYLRIIQNPFSDIDLTRIINNPPRGIGEQTLKILTTYQQTNGFTLWEAMEKCIHIALLSETQKRPVTQFVKIVKKIREIQNGLDISKLIDHVLDKFGLTSYHKKDKQRIYFWNQLCMESLMFDGNLSDYLEKISLQRETDIYNPHAEKVALMTLHAAKGLEFPVVFIAGCEEDLIPYRRNNEAIKNLEEERRLFYVGVTRAKQKLFLLHANSRFLFGERKSNRPSRFLNDIEQALKENRQSELKGKLKSKTKEPDKSQLKLF
jgi:DNA helicase II / ATP-dependent DNA helicase PcrA